MFYETQSVRRPPKALKNFVFCQWWPWPLTFTFKLVRARDQTCLPCEFGTNQFSGSQDISYTNKKTQSDGKKNRTFHSSLHVVTTENEWCFNVVERIVPWNHYIWNQCQVSQFLLQNTRQKTANLTTNQPRSISKRAFKTEAVVVTNYKQVAQLNYHRWTL